MATTLLGTPSQALKRAAVERWFFTAMALAMIATSLAGFLPSIVNPGGRREPLSLLAAAHGIVFFSWLLLFLVQSRLVATHRVALHRRLGVASIFVLALMIPIGYMTTTAMVRRGFDLSGDLHLQGNADYQAVFSFFNLAIFAILVTLAILYRRRPELHRRFMLFANIELMTAPLAHLIGHNPALAAMPHAIGMVPISMFVLAAIARDMLLSRRIHRLTLVLAILRMISGPLEAFPIGNSTAWHNFVHWLVGLP